MSKREIVIKKVEETKKAEETKKVEATCAAAKYAPKSDEEAQEMLKALNKWFEDKKKSEAKPKPKSTMGAKMEPKPEPKPEPKKDPEPKVKVKSVTYASDSDPSDGPRKLYKYRSLQTGKWVYVSDPFIADKFSGGEWTTIWVFMKDGKVHHELSEEEMLKIYRQ